jgi:hypothetical protein
MKASTQQKQALVGVMTRIYEEIRVVEARYGLTVGERDVRPRIEYFHDAIRQYTQANTHGFERTGRLSVESLAYDIAMLRQIQANPVSRVALPTQHLSGKDLVVAGQAEPFRTKVDGNDRYQLMDWYKNYCVLFVALLAEAADRNYSNRISENNAQVEDLASVLNSVNANIHKHGPEVDVAHLLNHIGDPEIKAKLAQMLGGRAKGKASVQAMDAMIKAIDKENAKIEKAHFTYVTSQLAVYENAKDVVKKMASSGMNVVGDFMAAAMAEANTHSRGR